MKLSRVDEQRCSYERHLGSEALLSAIYAGDVDHPDSDGNSRWAVIRARPLNHRGHFRAARVQDRYREKAN